MHVSSYLRWSFLSVADLTRTWSGRHPMHINVIPVSTTCSHCMKRTDTATSGSGMSRYCYPQLEKRQSALCSGFSWDLVNAELSLESVLLGTEIPDGGGGGIPNATLSPPNYFCINVGCDESHCDVLLIVSGKSQESVHRPQPLESRRWESNWRPIISLRP